MKSRITHIKKGLLTSLFLLLLGGIIFNSTFFLHTHKTACGKLVVHAHPFNKGAEKEDPATQHTHNKIDLQLISSIEYYLFPNQSIDIIYKPVLESEYLGKPSLIYNSTVYSLYSTRGPPTNSTFV